MGRRKHTEIVGALTIHSIEFEDRRAEPFVGRVFRDGRCEAEEAFESGAERDAWLKRVKRAENRAPIYTRIQTDRQIGPGGVRVKMRTQRDSEEFRAAAAIGRMGSRLLLRFHTAAGEPRERWFKPGFFDLTGVLDADLAALPIYERRHCPPRTFDPPVVSDAERCFPTEVVTCPRCGVSVGGSGVSHPRLAVEEFRLDTGETFDRDAYKREIQRRVDEKYPEIDLALSAVELLPGPAPPRLREKRGKVMDRYHALLREEEALDPVPDTGIRALSLGGHSRIALSES